MSFTLLLTCVGGELSPQVIRYLKSSRRHDVKVIGVDADENAAGRHFVDAFAVVPLGTDPHYVEAIAELAAKYAADLVLPTSDEEALALSQSRGALEREGCRVACADAETLRIVANKATCYERLAELGIPVPEWELADDLNALGEAVDALYARRGGAVVKPAGGRGGRGVCVIRPDAAGARPGESGREIHMNLDSFHRDYLPGFAAMLPAVVMQRLEEPVHDIDMLAWNGKPIRVVPRRRVDSALPNEGHTIVGNDDLIDLGRRLIEGFGLTWLYDCDVMYDASGTPGILEVNPRPSGSIATTIASGVPLFDDLISLAKGEPVPDVPLPVGRVVVPFKSLAVVSG